MGVDVSISGGNNSRWCAGVPRLAARLTSLLAGRQRWLGRFDDVRGGWLGRVGGILAGRGELFLQLLDGGLEGSKLSAQGVHLGLQPLAIGTWRGCVGIHDRTVYMTCTGDSTL